VLAELSFFFCQLCAKELDIEVVKKLDQQAPELLCKLEMLLPPGFFNLMQHMILHLLQEALKGGLCSFVGSLGQREWIFSLKPSIKQARGIHCQGKPY
jgi:hypothetical protein